MEGLFHQTRYEDTDTDTDTDTHALRTHIIRGRQVEDDLRVQTPRLHLPNSLQMNGLVRSYNHLERVHQLPFKTNSK